MKNVNLYIQALFWIAMWGGWLHAIIILSEIIANIFFFIGLTLLNIFVSMWIILHKSIGNRKC